MEPVSGHAKRIENPATKFSVKKDLVGEKFGCYQVLSCLGRLNGRGYCYKCLCDCGEIVVRESGDIQRTTICRGHTNKKAKERVEKKCSLCKQMKSINEFPPNKSKPDKRSPYCFACKTLVDKKYPRSKYAEYYREYERKRMSNDIEFRIKKNLRRRLSKAVRGVGKSKTTMELIGCEIGFLIDYLELGFDKNMSWENYGTYWEIDHIKPCALFNLTDKEQQKQCFHYSNLQPLEKKENNFKRAKYYE